MAEGSGAPYLFRRQPVNARTLDGTIFPAELTIVPLEALGQKFFTAFIRVVSSSQPDKSRSENLAPHAKQIRELFELSPEAIFICCDGTTVAANRAAGALLGAGSEISLVGRRIIEFVHPDFQALFEECEANAGAHGFQEQVWQDTYGQRIDVEISVANMRYNGSSAVKIVARDISERKRAEALQIGQNHILNLVATGSPLKAVLTEIAHFVERHSDRGICSILLLDNDGVTLSERIAPSLPPSYLASLDVARSGPANCSCGTAVFRREPVMVTDLALDPLWERRRELALAHGLRACTSWPIFGTGRTVLGSLALYFREPVAPSAQDIELFGVCTKLAGIAIERHASEERIRYLAHYDGLTALPNRFLFKEYLDLALRTAQRHGKQFAVLFLDLDKFKEVNDTLGHDAGDHVLREIAIRLRGSLRDSDKIARMGGDEFYVLVEDLNSSLHAGEVARKLVEEAARPILVAGKVCQLGASVGIAIFPGDGKDAQTLLANADLAMYEAKESGRNAYRFHASEPQNSPATDALAPFLSGGKRSAVDILTN